MVAEWLADVEARLLLATQSLWRLIWVMKGCDIPPAAICCLSFMSSLLARSILEWVNILARARSEPLVSYGGKVGN